jgi:carbon-monoxide dehydrogenase small subunit
VKLTVVVNGTEYGRDIEPRLLLIHFLRDELGLTGSHWGCDTSNCGACVVWLDEVPVKSCTVLAAMADGHRIRTVEGLTRSGGRLDPVQEGFAAEHGLQCGFCTPGMMMTARWLLDQNPDPSAGQVREAISGQICRCTGYENIVRSVLWAAKKEADDLRVAPPQGGRQVRPRPGHVCRRHRPARHAARRGAAQPAGARADHLRRRDRGARASEGRGGAHRHRPGRARPGLDADAVR